MKKRAKTGGASAKAGRRKAPSLRRDLAPKKTSRATPRVANEALEIARLESELNEAREHQTATAGVLRMISRFPNDVQSVLEAIVRVAGELCEAEYALLFRLRDSKYHVVCSNNAAAEYVRYFAENPISVDNASLIGRTALARQTVHIEDCLADPEYKLHVAARLGRHRTMLGVPLMHEGEVLGVVGLLRTVVKPFTEKQIELVTAFADEAVIAIENARLLNDLREALQQQTATADVLRVISSSPSDLRPVFETMVENATRLCEAQFGNLFLRAEGTKDGFHYAAMHGLTSAYLEWGKRDPLVVLSKHPNTPLARVVRTMNIVHIADLAADQSYVERDPRIVSLVETAGARTIVTVPLLKDDDVVGAIAIYRKEVRPFTGNQIALVQNFAAQAVIAIENTRLLNELRESLERQTATADVLKVISRSAFDLNVVLDALLRSAGRLCDADMGVIARPRGDRFYRAVAYGLPDDVRRLIDDQPVELSRSSGSGRALLEGRIIQICDIEADAEYTYQARGSGAFRTLLGVPMLRDGVPVGVMTLMRKDVQSFTDKQIGLVSTFADQAAIAIENVRLFEAEQQRSRELSESLEQQTATSEVLRVISTSPGELEPVFGAILEKATAICQAQFGTLNLYDGEAYRTVALHNPPAQFAQRLGVMIRPHPESGLAKVARTKEVVHIDDLRAQPPYLSGDKAVVDLVDLGGALTLLIVPMLKDGNLVGVISIYRQEVSPFTGKQIDLVRNFAAQAVIAIENTRLLNELRQRTTDLAESLEQQTATSKVLEAISSSPGDLKPVFEAILQNAVRLCGAKFGNLYLREGEGFRAAAMHNAPAAYAEQRAGVVRPSPSSTIWQAAQSKRPAQTADMRKLQAYIDGDPWIIATVSLGGYRSVLSVPMLHKDEVIGGVTIFRQEAGTFAERQIELLTNFAKQAVIAIENARLLRELRERTDQLAAQSQELAALNQQLEHRVSDQVGEIERMGRLRRFLPPQVADLIVASGSEKQLESHRREITALFCDLRGFTGFSESSDPEDVMALLRDYHAAIGEIIIKYSGTLERYAGDGVMVVFNDPVPLENPALQAVLMALEMRDAIGALTERWRRLGHEIGFGIGIAHGFATLGTIGFEGRFDYAAIGTVSNVASRLCDEAKPGQILISPRVLMNVENAVQVEPVGEFTLKGIRRPLAAYNVLSANSAN